MGQTLSRRIAVEMTPDADLELTSSRILPGAYIIKNKATGACLRLAPSTCDTAANFNSGSNDAQTNDVVGWELDDGNIGGLGDEIWWVEWDNELKAHIISNVSKGLVLDFRFLAVEFMSQKKVAPQLRAGAKGVVCARPKVKSLNSPRNSNKSSARSSIDLVTREEALTEEPPLMSTEDRIKKQRWRFRRGQPTSESFSIHNLYDPSIVIDLDWAKPKNGTKVQLCHRTGVNHQQWTFIIPQLPRPMVPIGSWVFIRNSGTGAFLHHVDKNYAPAGIRLPKWEGICEKREYWGLHWCFVRVPKGKNLRVSEGKEQTEQDGESNGEEEERWYIRNRLTGALLEHVDGKRRGESVLAENGNTIATHKRKQWGVRMVFDGQKSEHQGGLWSMVNVESGCVLDHYAGKSIQCHDPAWSNSYRQWKLMEASTPFTSHCSAILSPLNNLPPVDPQPFSLSPDIDTSSLFPLLMPSGASFHYTEQATWPFPAPAPCSRDNLGHEERCFFELMSRVETQLLWNDKGKKKRILSDIEEGWTSWAFGFSKGQMNNWNNLVNSEKVRGAELRERYVVSFGEAVEIIRELLEDYYTDALECISSSTGKDDGEKIIILPTRLTFLIIMATYSLDRVVTLRRSALGLDSVENIYSRTAGSDSEKQRNAKAVNKWFLARLESVLKELEGLEGWCRAGVDRKWFIQ